MKVRRLVDVARRLFRNIGFDVHRYPKNDGLARLLALLGDSADVIFVDVGASTGEYGADLRARGFRGNVSSIEPVKPIYAKLQARAEKDGDWATYNCAIGETFGIANLFVSSNNAESSSLLPIGDRHLQAFAESRTIGQEWVEVRTLDELFATSKPESQIAIKLDVQGFELQALKGASALFESGRVVAIQVEVSLVPLYEGGAEPLEIHCWIASRGFELVFVKPGFSDSDFRLLQVDLFYFRYGSRNLDE